MQSTSDRNSVPTRLFGLKILVAEGHIHVHNTDIVLRFFSSSNVNWLFEAHS
ncbi:hypothetical protein EYZ11_000579 [Aspergillus tanneri]|uniref:Uncharacterized protein n=1 Tax=Aspergillus tanneri TaxID=1220188 RepID=A0A4V3UQR1_9EURO|nr:hypothetical protein EYZ11_000579 [Aspergillus tanneri]